MCSVLRAALVAASFHLIIGATPRAAAQDEGDILVCRTGTGQLRIAPAAGGGYEPEANVGVLPAVTNPPGLFNGWADIEPGFDHVVSDQPALDCLVLQSGVQVRLELIQCDPAFKAITTSFSVIDVPGERALLGGSSLHTHLTWLIDSDDPSFDPLKTLWRATYKLVDTGTTGYSDSTPFTLYFGNVECTRGDCNGDGSRDARDVQAFVNTLLDPASRTAAQRCAADTNRDGYATVEDVSAFVAALLG